MERLNDQSSRTIDYLRISVTDRCNLRCIYCMPHAGVSHFTRKDILEFGEIVRFVRIAACLGIRKIRLTGGEPLVRKNLPYLVESLSNLPGIEEVSLTTNGMLLKDQARDLAAAGLRRVNVSLDSLIPETLEKITRGGKLNNVLGGIDAAESAGLSPVKINMIPIRGINDSEIPEFARLAIARSFLVRFIELMPAGNGAEWSRKEIVPADEILDRVSSVASVTPVEDSGGGPARYFRLGESHGTVGIISPISHTFCRSCNRMRLTSDGQLKPCLFADSQVDLKPVLRSGKTDIETRLAGLLRTAVHLKPKGHEIGEGMHSHRLNPMSRIGG